MTFTELYFSSVLITHDFYMSHKKHDEVTSSLPSVVDMCYGWKSQRKYGRGDEL